MLENLKEFDEACRVRLWTGSKYGRPGGDSTSTRFWVGFFFTFIMMRVKISHQLFFYTALSSCSVDTCCNEVWVTDEIKYEFFKSLKTQYTRPPLFPSCKSQRIWACLSVGVRALLRLSKHRKWNWYG